MHHGRRLPGAMMIANCKRSKRSFAYRFEKLQLDQMEKRSPFGVTFDTELPV
jgi:hypothetical protein